MSESDKASGDNVVGYPSQSQHQEITIDDRPQMSIDELLKVIKGANGMPVLFVPSSDGRLAAIAVDGFQCQGSSAEKKQQDFRAWLLLLTSLVATVSFTAGLAPPGGFWASDDKASGYVAGTSVMRDKFPKRYQLFYYSNTIAFFSSLMIIGVLAKSNINKREIAVLKDRFFVALVCLCLLSLGTTYISGTWLTTNGAAFTIAVFIAVVCYMSIQWSLNLLAAIRGQQGSLEPAVLIQ